MSDHLTPRHASARFDPRKGCSPPSSSGRSRRLRSASTSTARDVVDLWGGWGRRGPRDRALGLRKQIACVFSTTKAMTRSAAPVPGRPRRARLRRERHRGLARVRGPGQGGNQGPPSPGRDTFGRLRRLGAAAPPSKTCTTGTMSDRPAGRPSALVGTWAALLGYYDELRPPDRRSDPTHHRRAPGRVLRRRSRGC